MTINKNENIDKLLTPQEVCSILKIKTSTLYNWVYFKKIKAIKFSKRMIRFKKEDVLKLLEEKE